MPYTFIPATAVLNSPTGTRCHRRGGRGRNGHRTSTEGTLPRRQRKTTRCQKISPSQNGSDDEELDELVGSEVDEYRAEGTSHKGGLFPNMTLSMEQKLREMGEYYEKLGDSYGGYGDGTPVWTHIVQWRVQAMRACRSLRDLIVKTGKTMAIHLTNPLVI